jgi:hypothetical protein
MCRSHKFLDETGCILNEKMMPDVTITAPELEIDKKTKKLPDLAPTNPRIPYCFQETFEGKPLSGNFFRDFPPVNRTRRRHAKIPNIQTTMTSAQARAAHTIIRNRTHATHKNRMVKINAFIGKSSLSKSMFLIWKMYVNTW